MRISFLYHEFFATAATALATRQDGGCGSPSSPPGECPHLFNTAAGISILA
jgi:hypothetical protein